ncbi:MAG: DUF2007 domain-containing protein [Flavobacteriales bacterium]|nr:DUF2007 domain-containing protein [Flavobacteriales bacterium]
MDGWTLVHSDGQTFGAELVKSQLEAVGINAIVLNKRDSSYGMFGPVEVYVPTPDAGRAQAHLAGGEGPA